MLTRRHFIATGAAALVAAPAIIRAQTKWSANPFSLGIASGDPAPDGFVLWTRLAPNPVEAHGGMDPDTMPVAWEVAADEGFAAIVARGETPARPELAHSVHVEVAGLQPDRPYFYRFTAGGERSGVGRARTLPLLTATPRQLRFGMAGCQDYQSGYFTAYRHMAEEDLAFIFHYGDYIYEYGPDTGTPRQHSSPLISSLDDYRRRHAQYKTDPDLQRAHAAHPFFMTLDDHEVRNDWAGDWDDDDGPPPPEVFRLRRQSAFQAWYEHMPVRRAQFPNGPSMQLYRGARYGNLARFDFLDTRQYRTNQPCGDGYKTACPEVTSARAHMIDAEEEAWLNRNLTRRDARWNVVAQQVMMMSIDRSETPNRSAKVLNLDSWAGYEVQRRRLLARMRGLDNVVVLTGDEHSNYAGLLHDRDRPVAVEFVGTSVTSDGDGEEMPTWGPAFIANNPQLKFLNNRRGYLTCDVTPDEWRSNFMVLDKVSTPDGSLSKRATFVVERSRPDMREA